MKEIMIPVAEVEKLLQERMEYTFGGDPSEMEVYNRAVKKANNQIKELLEKYKEKKDNE